MSFDNKITDLKYHIDKLVPKDVCDYFIDFYKKHTKQALPENSYKHQTKKIEIDNFKCINLSTWSEREDEFIEPLNIAKRYINIMITNYVLHVQKNICPTYDDSLIRKSSNIRILKYDVGECIKDHTDVSPLNRASCTLNLNEDYEGGEFRFFDGRVKHTFKTGDAMLFPAEPIWVHGTEPVTKGTRYSINCFLYQ